MATGEQRLRRCIASYYGLITAIDMEIGMVIDYLEKTGELDNTIIFNTADHGDFAGEHGLFHKNLGLYESIQRIPFLLLWPSGPKGEKCDRLVESVNLFPTLCELCNVPLPENRDGVSLIDTYNRKIEKEAVFCEWEMFSKEPRKLSLIRTERYRLVYYSGVNEGELYDRSQDPDEINNLWDNPQYKGIRLELLQRLIDFTLKYKAETDVESDRAIDQSLRNSPSRLLHKHKVYWSDLEKVYYTSSKWPQRC
ncbi:MAG: sulfatase-like hydrolase/transferase [Lentisphaerae bacterium]|nr:sulfatase-like hydrolase/transferase [Lentisphaerota bacterium]MCP4103067.1 sulfatase-like hydrolase/transferase [Lentisphaerota bacterium]